MMCKIANMRRGENIRMHGEIGEAEPAGWVPVSGDRVLAGERCLNEI